MLIKKSDLRVFIIFLFIFSIPIHLFAQGQTEAARAPDYIIVMIIILMSLIVMSTVVSFIYIQRKLLARCTDLNTLREYFKLPFGVPVGTVRSVITFIIIALGLMLFSFQVFYSGSVKIPETLANIIMAVIAFYFGSRTGSKNEVASEAPVSGEIATPEEKNQVRDMIDKAKNIVDTVDAAKDILPENERAKLGGIIDTVKEHLSNAQQAEKEGKYSAAKTAATLIEDLVKKQDPLKDLLQNSVGTIGTIIGAKPAMALVGNILRVGSTLAGDYYEKWKKRVLDQPITIADVNPNVLDSDTAQAVFLNIDLFKRSFQTELMSNKPEDKSGLLATLKDLAAQDEPDALWKKYEKKMKGTKEEFAGSLKLLREMLVDTDLSKALSHQDFGDLNNYRNFADYIEKVKDDKEGNSILGRLLGLVQNIREKKVAVDKILGYLK